MCHGVDMMVAITLSCDIWVHFSSAAVSFTQSTQVLHIFCFLTNTLPHFQARTAHSGKNTPVLTGCCTKHIPCSTAFHKWLSSVSQSFSDGRMRSPTSSSLSLGGFEENQDE